MKSYKAVVPRNLRQADINKDTRVWLMDTYGYSLQGQDYRDTNIAWIWKLHREVFDTAIKED